MHPVINFPDYTHIYREGQSKRTELRRELMTKGLDFWVKFVLSYSTLLMAIYQPTPLLPIEEGEKSTLVIQER
jgi:hypothetical protein